MTTLRRQLLSNNHSFLTGRAVGTRIQDPAHESFNEGNINFTCLVTAAYHGTAWPELGDAIKLLGVSDLQPGVLFFISQVYAHKPVTGGYQYYVEVSMCIGNFDTNCVAMIYDETSVALKNGRKLIPLPEHDGSGVQGFMDIDWDALENIGDHGYGNQVYEEGALVPTLCSAGYWKSLGNPEINPPIIEAAVDVDGKIPLVYVKPAEGFPLIITLKGLKGPVTIKNVGLDYIDMRSFEGYPIDDVASGTIAIGKDATFRLWEDGDDSKIYTTGSFTPTLP